MQLSMYFVAALKIILIGFKAKAIQCILGFIGFFAKTLTDGFVSYLIGALNNFRKM